MGGGGYLVSNVWRKTLVDQQVHTSAADVDSHSEPLDLRPGIGQELIALLTISSEEAGAADTFAVVALEQQLPDGSWHRIARFARAVSSANAVTRNFFHMIDQGRASEFVDVNRDLAITDDAAAGVDMLIVGPLRARWIVTRGSAAAITWNIRVDVVVAGFAGLVS